MGHYSDAEYDLERSSEAGMGEREASLLLKSAHVHAMLAVADAIAHVADVVEDPGNS